MKRNRWALYSGIVLIAVGAAALLRIPYFYYHSSHVGNQLLKQANTLTSAGNSTSNIVNSGNTVNPVTVTGQPPKNLLGEVYIPVLHLKAPLVEGTADKELAVGVGHLTASVMPGNPGTSVIAAHNATWFRHIDSLKTGDKVEVMLKSGMQTFQVTKQKVVDEGSPVYNSSNATIVLETCYPTDALYLTPYRLLVYGKQVKAGNNSAPAITDAVNIHYETAIPKRIVKQGITLASNSLPMGKLTYTGSPNNKYVQSNAPLNAAAAAVRLYLGWLHASAHNDKPALHQLTPELKNNPLLGVNMKDISYLASFGVQLKVQGTTLQAIHTTTELKTGGKKYAIMMNCTVFGSQVSISKLTVQKR